MTKKAKIFFSLTICVIAVFLFISPGKENEVAVMHEVQLQPAKLDDEPVNTTDSDIADTGQDLKKHADHASLGDGKKAHTEETLENEAETVENALLDSAQEILSWQNDRGYIFADEESGEALDTDYDSYGEEALESLAEGGDKRANLLLGQKLVFSTDQDKRNKAANYLLEASAQGYSASLIGLGDLSVLEHIYDKSKGKLEEAREHAIDAQAWFEVAILRGDPLAKNPSKNFKYEYTDADEVVIKTRTEKFFNQLKARRAEMNLPPFNNDYPPALELIAN